MHAGEPLTVEWVGERWIRVSFSLSDSDDQTRDSVWSAWEALRDSPPTQVVAVTPAHSSLLVECRPLMESDSPDRITGDLRRRLELAVARAPATPRLIEVPVCYDPGLAPDLLGVAASAGIDPGAIPTMHTRADHRVRFIGFAPGFAYIDGLPEALRSPRLPRPRERVPAGSVAIAGLQTGIYPYELPGGWRIIGRTPLVPFDPHRDPPMLLRPGDAVRFVPISRDRFDSDRLSSGAELRG